MNIYTKFLSGKNEIVFIGLNATVEAVQSETVFCTRPFFWNILKNAGFISDVQKNKNYKFPYQLMANDVFVKGNLSKIEGGLGFTDIIDNVAIINKNSTEVIVKSCHLERLMERLKNASPRKIVLLGMRVTDEFVKLDSNLKKKWEVNKKGPNEIKFSCLGKIQISNSSVCVFVVPFPETSPIANKHEYYKKVLC